MCFVISPIGEAGSQEREWADGVLNEIIKPALEDPAVGYTVQRADDERSPGLITEHVIDQLLSADLVVADLSTLNPNVPYELAVRHATGKPLVQMMERGGKLPFDIADYRTIWFNRLGLSGRSVTIGELQDAVRATETRPIGQNPISRAINLKSLREEGSTFEQRVMLMLDLMRQDVSSLRVPMEQKTPEEVSREAWMQNAYGAYLVLGDLIRKAGIDHAVPATLAWMRQPGADYAILILSVGRSQVKEYRMTVHDGTVIPAPRTLLKDMEAIVHASRLNADS